MNDTHHAARLEFERVVREVACWRAAPGDDRAPAPAWWWGPAIAVLDDCDAMPRNWCAALGLREGASLADGARTILALFAEQTSLPVPCDFPRNTGTGAHGTRELHPRPSDDSAFQP